MTRSRSPRMSARAERRAVVALLTAFALLVQAWIPSVATAGVASAADMVICTQQGEQTAPVGPAPDRAPASHACQHCLCSGPAVDTPPPAAVAVRVRYVVAMGSLRQEGNPAPPRPGLAAPPPPSRGPPGLRT